MPTILRCCRSSVDRRHQNIVLISPSTIRACRFRDPPTSGEPSCRAKKQSLSAARRRVALSRSNRGAGLPLTVTRPELLNDGTDRDFRKLVHNIFAFMARHEAIRDGHARQIGLAGVEYTILISIGHLGLDGDVNVKTVADHLHMSGAFVTTVTSKLQTLGLAEKSRTASTGGGSRSRSPKRAGRCCGSSRPISARSTMSSSAR